MTFALILLVSYCMTVVTCLNLLAMLLRCTCMDNKRSPCLEAVAVQVRQQLKDVKGSAP
jgi:hypothetical protein